MAEMANEYDMDAICAERGCGDTYRVHQTMGQVGVRGRCHRIDCACPAFVEGKN